MGGSKFSASSSALGYLYQIRLALYLAIDSDQETLFSIEKSDDLEIVDGEGTKIIQVKNKTQGSLGDSSPDLWKTLRIWANLIKEGLDPNSSKFILITTSPCSEESAPGYLTQISYEKRNLTLALEKLEEAIKSSTNKTLSESFKEYSSLQSEQKRSLLKNTYVIDSNPSIEEVEELIKKKIGVTIRSEHIDPVYQRIEGWWNQRVITHMIEGSSQPISQRELHIKICDIRDEFNRDSLPIDFLNKNPKDIDPEKDSRLFVRQLREIGVNLDLIKFAIIDYYRAYSQRSKWVREKLVLNDELSNYESRLVEEWERTMATLKNNLPGNPSEDNLRDFGKKLFNWAMNEADIKIRPKVEERYVMRGSYNMLADEGNPRIWWHPEFIKRLEVSLLKERAR